ncbi:MAG TPA: DEAD/DEAH box helicase [Humibacter sp.]|nr:DEAD/DEAH box helicase [Humibacter sp.]
MPYNKKPAGTRPAKKSGPKIGSRSPGHRGYRPETEGAAPKKQRWNAEDRAARSDRSATSSTGGSRSERPNWEPREKRSNWEPRRDDRAPRRDGDDRAPRRDRDDRAPRRDFGDRAPRRDQDDRAPRRDFGDRAPRRDQDDRAPRRDFGDRGPRREFGDRGPRRDQDDRAPRRSYDERAPRRDQDDRAPRRDASDRPRRDFGDQAPRRDFSDRAPRRDFGDRAPRRSYDERPPRRDHDDRPRTERRDSNFYPSRPSTSSNAEGHHFTSNDDIVLERLEADAIQASDVEGVSFADLGLGGNIVRELVALGAEKPFPIQAATIPDVLAGKDVLGRGRTGSGKTIAFGAPVVERLMENGGGKKRQMGRKPRALILAPTRELALQIDRTVQPIARSVGLFTTQIYGGVPQHRQVGALQRGVDIVIGTPGRIEDLIEQGRLDLSQVAITVLDEADHMCDLGFLEPVQRILRHTADGGQKLLFSATLDKGVASLVDEFLVDPTVHEVAGEDQASSTIDHHVFVIEHRDKGAIIEQLTDRDGKTLVFARTRAFAEQLADQLDDAGIPAVSLHGDLNQSRRTRNLEKLTSGRVNVLVATDVAARGIHVDDIDLVIQADAPDEYKTYLHRSGRTGRAGKQGTVVTLIPRQRRRRMDDLLGRAEIEASFQPVIPGDQSITDLAVSVTAPTA